MMGAVEPVTTGKPGVVNKLGSEIGHNEFRRLGREDLALLCG